MPGLMLDIARSANLLFQLDLAARRAALVGAARHGLPGLIFVNCSPNSIYDPYTCLESTVRMVDELGIKRERLVFEITESERLPEMRLLTRIVGYYRENGFGVALDDFGIRVLVDGYAAEAAPGLCEAGPLAGERR